jgi:GT2 family glycosyltransferase
MPYEVILIDNASTDGSLEGVMEEFPRTKVIHNEQNIGFASACNFGILRAKGEFLLLLNPDTIVYPMTINTALNFIVETPEAGIVGCRLLDHNRQIIHSCRTFPTAWDYLFDSLFLTRLFPKSRLFGRFYLTNTIFTEPSVVDMVQGSFFLFRRQVVDDIGSLDERFFMYAEERDYCYRAKKAGWKVFYHPEAEMIHIGGVSTGQKSSEMFIEQQKSTFLFHDKHDAFLKVVLIKFFVFIGILIRVVIWTSWWFIRRTITSKSRRDIYLTTLWWFLHMNSTSVEKTSVEHSR